MKKNIISFMRRNLWGKCKHILNYVIVITLLLSTVMSVAGFLVDEQNYPISQLNNEEHMHSGQFEERSQVMKQEVSDFLDSSSENSTVCGYVEDDVTSFPIQGAQVSLTWQDQGQYDWNSTMTNESGFYSMNVAAGEIYLNAYKDGYFNEDTEWVEIGEYEILWINFSLIPYPPENAVVCGFVTDDITSLPIENANVDLNWRDDLGHNNWNSTTTNESGFYNMNVAAGEIRLYVYAEGYFYGETEWMDIGEEETLWVNISLDPKPLQTAVVCGYVDDFMTSLPIENANVNLNWRDDQEHYDWNSTTTNVSGFYSMNVAAGEISFDVSADGYFYEYIEWMGIGEYEILWVNVSLYPYPLENSTVCGYVTDEITGLPIENANVNLNWRDDLGHNNWNSTYTNTSGYYSMNVAAGEIRLYFYADNYFYNETEWFDVEEYEIVWINVSLYPEPPENSMVCGYVSDEITGLPIEGVNVNLDWRDDQGHYDYNYTMTNESGYYSMNVAAGIFNLYYYSEEYFYEWFDDEVIGEYEIVWLNVSLYPRPPQTSVVCGYITDFSTGLPLEDIWVSLSWRDNQEHWDGNSTQTNNTGYYSMNVAAGEAQISVYLEGYFDENSGWFEIDDYETIWVNLTLHPSPPENSVISGYVSDYDTGEPLEDVDISLLWRDEAGHDMWNSTYTNSSGFYTINTAAGEIFIRAYLDGYAWNATGWMTVGEYEQLWINFTLDPDSTPPTIYNVTVPEYVGLYTPGNISVDIYDDHLHLASIILYDIGNITFNQSLVIVYLIDYTGASGTFTIEEYNGTYGDLTQDRLSSPTTVVMLNNYSETNNLYTVAFFKKNESSTWEQIVVEFNYSNGQLKNIAIPISLPDQTLDLEYITDLIEPGVSLISPLALLPEGGWVTDLDVNYTLYLIGDPNNPDLNWIPLVEGEYAGVILAQDQAQNSNQSIFDFTVNHTQPDTEPPETNHDFDGTMGENDWYISCVEITLTATDDYSGVAITYYRIDGGDWMEYTEPFEICDDGEHALEYYSIDYAENVEEVKGPFDFKIDQTSPEVSLTVEKQGFNKWLFIADADDATSGVARVEFYVDDELVGEVTEPPYYFLWTGISFDKGQAIAYDNAGNSAESEEVVEVSLITTNYNQIFLGRKVLGEQSL